MAIQKQSLITGGLFSTMALGWFLANSVSPQILGAGVVAYGSGVAFATAVLKMNRLLKDGTQTDVEVGNGFSAAISFVAFFSALGSSKYFFNLVIDNGYSKESAVIFGLTAAIAGALQARYSILKDMGIENKMTSDVPTL
ncbi:MAG: hypothetical protein ACK5WS_04715 [Alphaproteobacteria bacterium]|jgi:hypothetical protein